MSASPTLKFVYFDVIMFYAKVPIVLEHGQISWHLKKKKEKKRTYKGLITFAASDLNPKYI